MVRLLLDAGADASRRSTDKGKTALKLATRKKRAEVVTMLVNHEGTAMGCDARPPAAVTLLIAFLCRCVTFCCLTQPAPSPAHQRTLHLSPPTHFLGNRVDGVGFMDRADGSIEKMSQYLMLPDGVFDRHGTKIGVCIGKTP